MVEASVASDKTRVFPLELDRLYPVVMRGDGVWVEDSAGKRYLDAMSGGSMAATLGHGRRDIIAAAREQAQKLSYVHNERLTNPARERLQRPSVAGRRHCELGRAVAPANTRTARSPQPAGRPGQRPRPPRRLARCW